MSSWFTFCLPFISGESLSNCDANDVIVVTTPVTNCFGLGFLRKKSRGEEYLEVTLKSRNEGTVGKMHGIRGSH